MVEKKPLFIGTLTASYKELQDKIRANPADPGLRVYLFQLLCVMGEFDRAITQLNISAEMGDENNLMAQVCRPLLNCEALRQKVFAGEVDPLLFGEPEEWISLMVQALKLNAQGDYTAAEKLRETAYETAPAVGGKINGEPFEWIADADSRLGPVLEIIIEGRYYLTAMSNIKEMVVGEPCDLRDAVWLPASFTWKNEGQTVGFIPTRYEGTLQSRDDPILLARKTQWEQKADNTFFGMGQRMLTTDQNEYPIMDIREIRFSHE